VENVFGAVNYDFASGFSYIFNFVKKDFCAAGSNAVYAFDACGNKCGAYAVQACRDSYVAICAIVFAVKVNFDSADTTCFLKFSQVKFGSE
jgi:hypothetical protein